MIELAENIKKAPLVLSLLEALPNEIRTQNQKDSDYSEFQSYTTTFDQPLRDISLRLGSEPFEDILYIYNVDKMSVKASKEAGMELAIPINIANFPSSGHSPDFVLHIPSWQLNHIDFVDKNQQLSGDEIPIRFREVFRPSSHHRRLFNNGIDSVSEGKYNDQHWNENLGIVIRPRFF